MSRDNDLKSDSPKSRHDMNLDEPLNRQQLYETKDNNGRIDDEYISFEPQNRKGGIEIHKNPHFVDLYDRQWDEPA